MANFSAEENQILIEELQEKLQQKNLPVLIAYIVLCIIGIVGNIVTFIYFSMKLTKRPAVKLIAQLGLIDCWVCLVAFPIFVLSMLYQVTHTELISCKIISFMAHWAISASTGMLWAIAVDRHRKVCFPHGYQMSQVFATRLVVGLLVFTFLQSARELSFYEIVKFDINYPGMAVNVTAPSCAYSKTAGEMLAFKIFNIIDVILLCAILATLVITYTHIVIVLIRLKRFEREHSSIHRADSKPMVARVSSDTPVLNRVMKDDVTETTSSDGKSVSGSVRLGDKPQVKRKKRIAAERKMSVMMLVVSLAFVMCFAPYFGLRLSGSWKGQKVMFTPLQMFIYRFPFLNSVLNPLIYVVMNPHFRKFVLKTFRYCKVSDRSDQHHSM